MAWRLNQRGPRSRLVQGLYGYDRGSYIQDYDARVTWHPTVATYVEVPGASWPFGTGPPSAAKGSCQREPGL
jgi:hypothetical protein